MKITKKIYFQFFLSTILFVGTVSQAIFGWFYLNTTGRFGDLLYVLEKTDCLDQSKVSLYSARTQDPCSGYIYGSTLIKFLNLLEINAAKIEFVGFLLIAIFCVIFIKSIFSAKVSNTTSIFFLGLFFSPPIVLLLERGNIDILILPLISVAAYFFSRDKVILGSLVIILAGTFKFYPIFLAFVAILLLARGWKKIFLLIICFLAAIIIFNDIIRLPFLPWDARNMFGNIIWGEYLAYALHGANSHGAYLTSTFLGIFVLIVIFLITMKITKNKFSKFQARTNPNRSDIYNFGLFSGIYLTCYFSGLNVDYRLVFLLMAAIYFEKIFIINRIEKFIWFSALTLSFFLSYISNLLQPIGDLTQLLVVITLLVSLRVLLKLKIHRFFNKLLVIRNIVLSSISGKS